MAHLKPIVCPDCRRDLLPRHDPRRRPVIVSCQCGLQLLALPHERRPGRFNCLQLRDPEAIVRGWELVRAADALAAAKEP